MAGLLGFLLTMVTAVALSVGRSWRWSLAWMAGAQLGIFLQMLEYWPLEQAAIALVGGWMAVAVIGASQIHAPDAAAEEVDAGAFFRFIVFGMLFLVAWSTSAGAGEWLNGISPQAAASGLLLTIAGILRSGMVKEPMQVILSILMAFTGFALLYAAVESSVLVTALLAIANLCLAFVGAYLSGKPEPHNGEAV